MWLNATTATIDVAACMANESRHVVQRDSPHVDLSINTN